MDSNINLSGVAVSGMPASFRAVKAGAPVASLVAPVVSYVLPQGHVLPQEHPAAPAAGAGWLAAAAISPQRERRTAAATGASVDRSPV